jgi:hypothetical protein
MQSHGPAESFTLIYKVWLDEPMKRLVENGLSRCFTRPQIPGVYNHYINYYTPPSSRVFHIPIGGKTRRRIFVGVDIIK